MSAITLRSDVTVAGADGGASPLLIGGAAAAVVAAAGVATYIRRKPGAAT